MTRTSLHHRSSSLRAVIAAADERRDGLLPTDVPGVRETFADDLALLTALQLHWHTRLGGHIERQQLRRASDLRHVELGWAAAADAMPGVRAILDRCREHPGDVATVTAMSRATTEEHVDLAVLAGRATRKDPRAAELGAAVEASARARRSQALSTLALRAASDGETVALAHYRPRRRLLARLLAHLPARVA